MLWCGLLISGALLAELSILGNRTRHSAALVGVIGYATIIDEIGKFITRDNDYFFQPSISLIYITFVLIYLAFRDLRLRRTISSEEYLVNAINDFEEAIINDLQPEERDRALRYLGAITEKNDLIPRLAALIEQASVQPRPHGFTRRIRQYVVAGYVAVGARSDRFGGHVTLLVLQLAINAGVVALIVLRDLSAGIVARGPGQPAGIMDVLPTSDWLLLIATLIPSMFVVIAVITLPRSRMTALRFFHRAVLLSICFTEVFLFYRNQGAALLVLAFNLFSLACVSVAIGRETRNRADTSRI
jgi:hypothetical protein